MKRWAAAVMAAVLALGGFGADAANPAPVGTVVALAPGVETVMVTSARLADPVTDLRLAPARVQLGDGGVAMVLDVRNPGTETLRTVKVRYRLIDNTGREWRIPIGAACGDRTTHWSEIKEIRPGGRAVIAVCFVLPAEAIPGAFLTIQHQQMGSMVWHDFAIFPGAAGTPVASPVASPLASPVAR